MEERIAKKDILMTLLKNINGRYHSDYKTIINFLLRFSSTGLYKKESNMLDLIKSDAEKMNTALVSAKQVNSNMILHKQDPVLLQGVKELVQPTYKTAIKETYAFCERFYDIREYGGSIGAELITQNVLKTIQEIQKLCVVLEGASENLEKTHNITAVSRVNDFRMDIITNNSRTIIESTEQNYKKMLTEFKKQMGAFHTSLLTHHL